MPLTSRGRSKTTMDLSSLAFALLEAFGDRYSVVYISDESVYRLYDEAYDGESSDFADVEDLIAFIESSR